jgi:hypothetical protein
MKIHLKRCEFIVTSVVYLGHKILPNGIMVHWAKVLAILEMPNPTVVHTLRSFIKLCNSYRIYVQDFNTIVHLLYALSKKDVAWTWSEKAQEVFNTLKEKLSKLPIMRRLDFSKVFHSIHWLECSWYWCYSWPTWWRKQRICYRLCISKQQQGWEQLLFIRKGVSYYYMGHHTFQVLSLWHQIHFVYQPLAYQVVDDQW